MAWRYRFYGLETDSAIDLGALPVGSPDLPADVTIERGEVRALDREAGQWFENDRGTIIIDLPPAARFRVESGNAITLDGTDAGLAALRWRLLGIGFGAVLHQRGILALHATFINMEGRNIGLVGGSGAGKSTLAAWLQKRGHAILIDDVCAVVPDPARAIVEPGNGLLRLWEDATRALGGVGGQRLDPEIAKYEHFSPTGRERVTIDALVDLAEGDTFAIAPLDAGERIGLCLRNSYCRDIMLSLGGRDRNLAQCAAMAGALSAFKLTRPRGFDLMNRVAEGLEMAIAAMP